MSLILESNDLIFSEAKEGVSLEIQKIKRRGWVNLSRVEAIEWKGQGGTVHFGVD